MAKRIEPKLNTVTNEKDIKAKANATRQLNKALREEQYKREKECRKQQQPIIDAEREMILDEIQLNERDINLIEQLMTSRMRLGRSIFNFRNPQDGEKPLRDELATGEMDLLMMDATTLGIAVGMNDGALFVDKNHFDTLRRSEADRER